MTVGGWYDAEDLYGPLNIYKTIEATSPDAHNTLVMGPWGHGDWATEKGKSVHNHIYFGDSISTFYQREIERRFFAYYLKGEGVGERVFFIKPPTADSRTDTAWTRQQGVRRHQPDRIDSGDANAPSIHEKQ